MIVNTGDDPDPGDSHMEAVASARLGYPQQRIPKLLEPLITKPECCLGYNGQANVVELGDVLRKTLLLHSFVNVD